MAPSTAGPGLIAGGPAGTGTTFPGAANGRAGGAADLSGPADMGGADILRTAGDATRTALELAAEFTEGAAARDADRVLPWREVELLSRRGLYALTVPAWLGGPDLPPSAVAEVIRIIATADPSIAQIPHSHFVYVNLLRWLGTQDQQRAILGQVLAGARLGNAQSEAGTPTLDQIRTTLAPDGDDYVVNGEKFYCTGALFAHIVPVLAKGTDGAAYIAYVPRQAEGLTVVDDWSGMGQRTTASGTVRLAGVRVHRDAVVQRDPLFAGPQTYGAFAQLLHTAIDVGIARGALTDAVAFIRARSRPWFEAGVDRAADDPLLIQRIGELTVCVRAAEALLAEAGQRLDAAERDRQAGRLDGQLAAETSIAVATAKSFADQASVATASALFEVSGTRSAAESLNLDRHWRNARTHTLHDPVRWKLQHIGRWVLSGTPPPGHGLL
jgi:SfnB family sulfur acquisition oxidoreductase